MKMVLAYVLGTLIFLPLTVLIICYMVFRKILKKQANDSFGYAADVTTIFLYFSVTIAISTLWNSSISAAVFVISILIGMTMTYMDWRTKKEIQVLPLLKRIWRVQFLYLIVVYAIVWLVGIIQSVIFFIA